MEKIEAAIIEIFLRAGVAPDNIEECLMWAFGPGAWYVPIYPDWVDRWHKLHPGAPRMERKDGFVETIYMIGVFYCQHLVRMRQEAIKK